MKNVKLLSSFSNASIQKSEMKKVVGGQDWFNGCHPVRGRYGCPLL
jgi:natural product precursor